MRILLIHWHAEEAQERAELLQKTGVEVAATVCNGGETMKTLKSSPADVIIISLDRMPSHGREVGQHLRQTKRTRHIPLIYVGGAPEKVEMVQTALSDAVFTSWAKLGACLKRAKPLENPIVPTGAISTGRPLVQKLGIRAGMRVGLTGAPDDFEFTLDGLPENVQFVAQGPADLWIWFVRSAEEFLRELDFMAVHDRIWIARRKGRPDLKEQHVRSAANRLGLVDYKVCSIDDTWTGLLFKLRSTEP